jgi:hypothetical protein
VLSAAEFSVPTQCNLSQVLCHLHCGTVPRGTRDCLSFALSADRQNPGPIAWDRSRLICPARLKHGPAGLSAAVEALALR